MKRRSKKLLLTFVVVLLVVAGLGWSVAEGHWPAVNRWAERKLVTAIRDAGFTPSAVPLRELSWKRAEAGPVALELPGVAFQIEHARAELGWAVWREQGALDFNLRGARVILDLARLEELRAWRTAHAATKEGKSRDFTFEVTDGVIELRHGALRREVGFAGRIRWADGKLSLETRLSAPELRAELVLTPEGRLEIAKGSAKPEAWRELLAAVVPAEMDRLRPLAVEALEFFGTANVAAGGIGDFEGNVLATRPAWTGESREFRSETMLFVAQRSGDRLTWKNLSADAPRVRWENWRLSGKEVKVEPNGESWRVRLPAAELSGDGVQAQGELEFEATGLRAGWPDAAKVKLASARLAFGGLSWTSDSVSAAWDGRVVQFDLPRAELTAPWRASVSSLKVTVREPTSDQPVADGSVQLSAESAPLLKGSGWEMSPAQLTVPVSFQASLARGQESVRATVKLPAEAWQLRRGEMEVTANAALTLTTTFDREFVSGRLGLEGEGWKLRIGQRDVSAGKGEFSLRWPRVWWSAIRDWQRLPTERVVREALWVGDADLTLSEATLSDAELGQWRGVSFKARARGAEFSPDSGFDFGFAADEGDVAGVRIRDVQVQCAGGFDQARVELGAASEVLPVRVTGVQQLTWRESLAAKGQITVPEFDLAAAKGLETWLPWLRKLERGGTMSGALQTDWTGGKLATQMSAALRLRNGVFNNEALGAQCEGVQADLKFSSLSPLTTDGPQKITFERGKLSGVELTSGAIALTLLPGRLQVGEGSFGAFGGQLQNSAFETPLTHLEMKTLLLATKVRLEEMSQLFPSLTVKIAGPVSGAVAIDWNAERKQVHVGSGVLDLVPGELSTVVFPEDFDPLTGGKKPTEFGYGTLKKVESAIRELHANRLHIETYPANAQGQSVLIRMVGAPAGRFITAPVFLDFNVYAPLDDLIDWSRKGDLSLEGVR